MEKLRKPAYYCVLEISDDLRQKSFIYPLTESRLVNNGFQRNKIPNSGVGIKGLDWANVSSDIVDGLTSSSTLFVMKNIVPAMKKYNLLWHWPAATKRAEKMAIKELCDKRIIFRTEAIGIYLVNPIKIWKGDSITCVEATKQLLRENGKPCIALIHDLRPGTNYIHEVGNDSIIKLLGTGNLDT